MDIDISINGKSLTINIENPFRLDVSRVMNNIIDFGSKSGIDLSSYELDKLVPIMVRGVAGCEEGCPSDAKGIVREGFGNFNLSYVEGGILKAFHSLKDGGALEIKVFPDF